jgi:hypothetical protein
MILADGGPEDENAQSIRRPTQETTQEETTQESTLN